VTCTAVCREIRNVDLQKAGRAKDAPKPKAEDMANPQTSTMVRWNAACKPGASLLCLHRGVRGPNA
jgi:hypothetical protein